MRNSSCNDCGEYTENCSCSIVDEFEGMNDDFLDDITELEASEMKGASRCLCCMFFACRCKAGLDAKRRSKVE